MPNEAFAWATRLKAVEREYVVARFAADRLDQQARADPSVLRRDLRLLNYLRAFRIRMPRNAEPLINRVCDRVRIPTDDAAFVHAIRLYRNTLIHDDAEPAVPVSMRDATRSLGIFMGWLQRYW